VQKKISILLFAQLLFYACYSQININIDTTEIAELDLAIVSYFDHFYIEYLNTKMTPTSKEKAQLKRYSFYQKDKKCSLYPSEFISKKSRLLLEGREISASDPLSTMNGVYTIKDKKGLVYEEVTYTNGFITKHVIKSGFLFHPKQKGKSISELAEFDYSEFPFILHYVRYGKRGEIKKDIHLKYTEGNWISDDPNYSWEQPVSKTESSPIKIMDGQKLDWSDFWARPSGSSFGASIYWGFLYKINDEFFYEKKDNDSILRLRQTAKAYCAISRDKSWARIRARTDDVLNHEQGHVDIAYYCALEFNKTIKPNISEDYLWRNEVDSMYKSSFEKCKQIQNMYDVETVHGLDLKKQKMWTDKIHALILKMKQ
jgi:hypothetical protein